MKIGNFVDSVQATVNTLYPDLRISIASRRDYPYIAQADMFIAGTVCIDISEWEKQDNSGKIGLTKTRVLEMLKQMKDKIEQDVKEITDAKTEERGSNNSR